MLIGVVKPWLAALLAWSLFKRQACQLLHIASTHDAVATCQPDKLSGLSAALCCFVSVAVKALDSLTAVREAAEVSLNSFFGLLLDNTQVHRWP